VLGSILNFILFTRQSDTGQSEQRHLKS